MAEQYIRDYSILIDGEPFIERMAGHQFRVIFDIVISPQDTFGRADIQIYNLSKDTNINKGADIVFSAGYQTKFDTLFAGSVTNIFRERRGPDVITRLLCKSGQALGDRGTISATYSAGAKLTDVLLSVARTWPRQLVIEEEQFTDEDAFPTGFAAYGDITYILDGLAEQFDFAWSLDRDALVISRLDKERKAAIFDINQYTGMVGMPEVNRGPNGLGVTVTSRINPLIRTSSRINVQSEYSTYNTGNMYLAEYAGDASANGEYNVHTIHYQGDTHGDDWNMTIDAIRAGTKDALIVEQTGVLVWGTKVSREFRAKIKEIAQKQNLDANWYMAIMAFETGGTFSPSEKNPRSGATGLIQFMPKTAEGMGTSTARLSTMSAVQQLDYVEKYFQPYLGRIRNLADMYMAVLWPKAISQPMDYVLFASPSIQYNQNAELDKNKDGTVTKAEAAERVFRRFEEGKAHAK